MVKMYTLRRLFLYVPERSSQMTVSKQIDGSKMTVEVAGRLDTTTAPQLEEEFKSSLDNVNDLVLDLSGLEYISSAGLRVLLASQKVMNTKGSMKVTGVSDVVMEIFEVTGFTDILTIER